MARASKAKTMSTFAVQFAGKSFDPKEIEQLCKEDYASRAEGTDPITDIKIYVNTDEQRAYYIVNDVVNGWYVAL